MLASEGGSDEEDEGDAPEIPLGELLDDLEALGLDEGDEEGGSGGMDMDED